MTSNVRILSSLSILGLTFGHGFFNIEITSWLVSAYDFYSRVVKDDKTNKQA